MGKIDQVTKANDLVETLKSAILNNIIITIRNSDTHELLWSCHTGEFYGEFKKFNGKLEVDQDLNLTAILKEIKNP